MERSLTDIFSASRKNTLCETEANRIQRDLMELRKTLSKRQRQLLLRIVDDEGLILEQTAQDRYEEGFRTGIRVMFHCLYPD